MAMKSLEDALVEELRDLLSAEKQLTKALPKMAKKASSKELKSAFEQHVKETEKQVERLEQAFELVGRAARSKRCIAMEGIVGEGQEVMGESAESQVLDAMLIAAAQKVEHYEIAAYGTVCAWCDQLGKEELSKLLKETLSEEIETDKKLTKLANQQVNQEAVPAE